MNATPPVPFANSADEMLTKDEVAARLKVSVRTIEQWQHDGCLPFLKLGQVILFHWPSVVKHLIEKFTVCKFAESTPHPAPLPDRGGEGIKPQGRST